MEFRTPVELPRQRVTLTPQSAVLTLGSCFAQSIGSRIQAALPPGAACVNPFGVLYNPESVRRALEIVAFGDLFFPDSYLFQGQDGLWHSWLHSTHFSAPEREACRQAVLQSAQEAQELLRRADLLCLTWGTNRAYVLREEDMVVGNCHKEPAQRFQERALSTEEICRKWDATLQALARAYPALRVVLTVSPYRYAKYGLHGSQLAKATLLLAQDQLCAAHPCALYFPAYEIVTDELRDYRFYEPDMLHPSQQAADYVWERFAQWSFSDELRTDAAQREKQHRAQAHRPIAKP
ncbi:MAG: GSCFA domain-containing protein [Alloprevotella sp.]|nr:GSCFA domain-containing protein [Alloprevotella sp.]